MFFEASLKIYLKHVMIRTLALTQVQGSPDKHTMLNHTTLLFAPNFPGIKWNVNKFALIMAQKSPDNHTIIFQFSTFDTFIHQLLPA